MEADLLRQEDPIVSSARMAIHWPDRHLWGARILATRAEVLGLIERYPWAAGMVAVPLTIIGLAGVMLYPFVFGPLLVLLGVALVAIEYYADQQAAEHHPVERPTEAAIGASKWSLFTGSGRSSFRDRIDLPQLYTEARARMDAAEARVRADDLQSRAAAAQLLAAEAEKQAEVAQARVAQLRLEAEAKTQRNVDGD